MQYLVSLVVLLVSLTGCMGNYNNQNLFINSRSIAVPNSNNTFTSLNNVISFISDQLLLTTYIKVPRSKLILTSFVDLNRLNKTTTFGRLLGESMFNELHIRKFKIIDFRGQDSIVVNADGEFHITRDIKKLKKQVRGINYILVGTYTNFENNSILINARILDTLSGDIISSARIIYAPKDCSLFDICNNTKRIVGIDIVSDYCSQVSCPNQNCKSGICNNSALY